MAKTAKNEMLETEQRYIDSCDEQLVHALAQRLCGCQMMVHYAPEVKIDTPQYWTATKKKLQKFAKSRNIPYDMVEKVYKPIIELSKQLLNQE